MRLSIISFTENGKQLSESIVKLLERELEIRLYTKCEAGIKTIVTVCISHFFTFFSDFVIF